jgi:mannitol-1-phosphate 5-dehydrogenase
MGLTGTRSFVGFGFGAIQAGLFLYEAYRSGAFNRLTVAEVLPGVVADVRAAGGVYALNIAHADRIESVQVGPVAIENPGVAEDRERLIAAVAAAGEIATAVPSVRYYAGPGPDSLHRILAEGLRRKAAEGGPRAVVYAAENTANAAAILADCVLAEIPAQEQDAVRAQVRFLDTVIAKMCGVHENAPDLAPITPGGGRAFLVEAFNRILISRIDFGAKIPFQRGIAVFEEKADLAPFEEAKLYGHNAVHAMAAYLAMLRGVAYMADLRDQPGMMALMHAALEDESGAALLHKYGGLDPFFTPAGYAEFADDLLARMVNPYLRDTPERVGRDPARKLGWDDRLIGAMRMCRAEGVMPRRYALGAAAALHALGAAEDPSAALRSLWRSAQPDPAEEQAILDLVQAGLEELSRWQVGK